MSDRAMQVLAEEIGRLNQECNRLYDRIQSNLETAKFQREQAFKAGYHCRRHADQKWYSFDPALAPGDPEGAYQAWLDYLEAEGIQASLDAGREP